jgi:UrcA family protein
MAAPDIEITLRKITMSTSTSKHAASLAVLCVAGFGAALALADDPPPTVKLQIPHNMDKVHAAQLYRQIQRAAQQVCEPLDGKELERKRLYNSCVARAVADAVAQVRSPQLTTIHLAVTGAENPRL